MRKNSSLLPNKYCKLPLNVMELMFCSSSCAGTVSWFAAIFNSLEHKVLMVSYCDQSLSVVRALSTFCFKRLLLQNG